MRVSSVAFAASLALVSISTSLSGQKAADAINPRSLALLAQARTFAAAGNLSGATDAGETAVAVDPRNRAAFLLLAGVADRQALPGKSIRLYREALELDPNDVAALRGQGEALVQKGAVIRAQQNLAKIRTLCKKQCADATALAAVIAKGPPVATAQATPTVPTPTTPSAAKE